MNCEECKRLSDFSPKMCDACASKNILKIRKGKYYFQGQVFKRDSWYRKMANYLSFDNDSVKLRRMPDEIRIEYIKTFVQINIKKTTFLMLILPCAVLLLTSLVILLGSHLYQIEANYLNANQIDFLRFVGFLFFALGLVLLVKIIIFQNKVIMLGTDKRIRMKHLSKKQYYQILDVFKKE